MKKFLIFLLFLLIIGGTGFYFGWAQFKVPLGSYGVMRSKTHGTDPQVFREGEFRWLWYMLIPTNAEMLTFSPKQVSRSIRNSGSLPSGRLYASIAELDTDFSWEISGDFSFSVKGDALPSLVLRENISNEQDLAMLEDNYARQTESLLLRRLASYGENENRMEAILFASFLPELSREIESSFPELENVNCRIQALRFPDYGLYRSLKGVYDEYLAHQRKILEEDALVNAESRVGTRLRMDELQQYGEILSRYPVLLQFLAMEKGLPSSVSFGE
jgi:hypothetical protein